MQSASRPRPTRTLLVLTTAAMAWALAQTALFPALPELIRVFDSDASAVAWTFTGYLLAAAVLTPVVGRLGDMFGKRRMLVIALAAFAGGNVVSAVGDSLHVVVAGRVLQGVAGGVFPLAFAIIRDEFPPERVRTSIGLISATAGIGSGVGLVMGGLLVDHASYHWIFWISAALAVLAGLASWRLIPESPHTSPARVDVRGAAILAVGLVMPLVAITQAPTWGWGGARTLGLIGGGLVVLAGWVAVERATADPLANIATLSRPPVLMTNLVTVLTGFGMFGVFLLVPQLVQAPTSTGYGFAVNATEAGLIILPGALTMIVVGPLSGVLGERLGSRIPLAVGGMVTATGVVALGLAHGSELLVVLLTTVTFAGIGMSFAAMPNLIIDAVPRQETGEATGFNTVMRAIGTSLGGQVCATILTGTVTATQLAPSDDGFRTAFLVSGAAAFVAAGLALLIPQVSASGGDHLTVMEEIGAAAPLAEPAYAAE